MSDNVNHPSHYETGKFECIDVMLETQGYLATLGFCICNVFKYSYRHGGKNGKEDVEKLGWYRDKYLELLDRESEFIKDRDDIANDLRKMLPSAYARLVIGTPIPEPPSVPDNDLDARLAPSGKYVNCDGPGVPDGMCAMKDIPEVEDDFAKKMNPPVEEEKWICADHLVDFITDPRFRSFMVPDGKVLETRINNGTTLIWKPDTKIVVGPMVTDKTRDLWVDDGARLIHVIEARYIDESEFKEGSNG